VSQQRDMTLAAIQQVARTLYRAGDDRNGKTYAQRLFEFCHAHDWAVHPNQRRLCIDLLHNPGHICTHHLPNIHRHLGGMNIDHPVLLRRGPSGTHQATQWAVLSQPYNDDDPSGQALHLGEAPYGLGTHALLYAGTERAHVRCPTCGSSIRI